MKKEKKQQYIHIWYFCTQSNDFKWLLKCSNQIKCKLEKRIFFFYGVQKEVDFITNLLDNLVISFSGLPEAHFFNCALTAGGASNRFLFKIQTNFCVTFENIVFVLCIRMADPLVTTKPKHWFRYRRMPKIRVHTI